MNDHFDVFLNIEPVEMRGGDRFAWQVGMVPNASRYSEIGHLCTFSCNRFAPCVEKEACVDFLWRFRQVLETGSRLETAQICIAD